MCEAVMLVSIHRSGTMILNTKMSRRRIQAIPPSDYTGSVGEWMTKLQERGYWDGEGWHGDVMIPEDDWWEILDECEQEKDIDD